MEAGELALARAPGTSPPRLGVGHGIRPPRSPKGNSFHFGVPLYRVRWPEEQNCCFSPSSTCCLPTDLTTQVDDKSSWHCCMCQATHNAVVCSHSAHAPRSTAGQAHDIGFSNPCGQPPSNFPAPSDWRHSAGRYAKWLPLRNVHGTVY
jgi:hypothetical protein